MARNKEDSLPLFGQILLFDHGINAHFESIFLVQQQLLLLQKREHFISGNGLAWTGRGWIVRAHLA